MFHILVVEDNANTRKLMEAVLTQHGYQPILASDGIEALDVLDRAGMGRAVFSDVDPNPNEANMTAGIAVYLAGGHDGVICFGGASRTSQISSL